MPEQEFGSSKELSEGLRLLDRTYERIHRDPLAVSHSMSNLLQGLHQVRRQLSAEQWKTFCKQVVPNHELARVIRQDPFTLHSVQKPRGYAGDAALLDYIYGHQAAPASDVGKTIFDFTTNTPTSRAVRTRAHMIAGIVDRMAERRSAPRILSIACGHLREADMSQAVREGRVSEYVAFDQDTESLALVRQRFGNGRVRTVQGSVADLLMGRHKDLTGFDFVYAAGLYDYLSQKLASRMTSWMFNATRPGGITLLTNYLRDIDGAGYMEAFMEWELIFRSPQELVDTAGRIPPEQIADKKTYIEEGGMIVFVELHKAGRVRSETDIAFRPGIHREEVPMPTPRPETPVVT